MSGSPSIIQILIIPNSVQLKIWQEATISSFRQNNGYFPQINYHIHTDAIKQNLIPATLSKQQMSMVYASEADVLNVALFGFTAKEWRDAHADLQGNVRDYATVNQLICLSNMESLNSVLIKEGLPQPERLQKLNQIAISQMTVLESIGENKLLK